MKILVENENFRVKLKFLLKMKILVENENFRVKLKILVKNDNFG